MDLAGYFNQTRYFSESAGDFLTIEEMPYSHAYYAFRKLVEEFGGDFYGTPLFSTFMAYLNPPIREIRRRLREHGTVSVLPVPRVSDMDPHQGKQRARMKIYEAGRREKKKVKTHTNGKWIEGSVVVPKVAVKAKGRKVSSG